jgi:hypothetical protein
VVVDDFQPGREQAVELGKLDTVVDLDQKLIADGPEKPLDFALGPHRQMHLISRMGCVFG